MNGDHHKENSDKQVVARSTKSTDIEKRKSFADMKLAQVAPGGQSWPFEDLEEEPDKLEPEISSEEEALPCDGHNGNGIPNNGSDSGRNGSDVVENNVEAMSDSLDHVPLRQFDPVNEHTPDLRVSLIKGLYISSSNLTKFIVHSRLRLLILEMHVGYIITLQKIYRLDSIEAWKFFWELVTVLKLIFGE